MAQPISHRKSTTGYLGSRPHRLRPRPRVSEPAPPGSRSGPAAAGRSLDVADRNLKHGDGGCVNTARKYRAIPPKIRPIDRFSRGRPETVENANPLVVPWISATESPGTGARKRSRPARCDAGEAVSLATSRTAGAAGSATCRAGSPFQSREEATMDWHNVITIIVIIVQSARLA
jgi:hypothetical protein